MIKIKRSLELLTVLLFFIFVSAERVYAGCQWIMSGLEVSSCYFSTDYNFQTRTAGIMAYPKNNDACQAPGIDCNLNAPECEIGWYVNYAAATFYYCPGASCSQLCGSENDPTGCTTSCSTAIDIGLRIYDGTQVVKAAAEPLGTLTSPLRIAKGGNIYGIILVSTSDSTASKIHIQTASGVKAIKKLP